MAEPNQGPGVEPIEVVPVVVLSAIFPARPSSIPDIRAFVRRCLAESPLTEEGTREVSETVFRALLDAAGPTGSINVAFRIFPEHVEVDVLHSDTALHEPAPDGRTGSSERYAKARDAIARAAAAEAAPGSGAAGSVAGVAGIGAGGTAGGRLAGPEPAGAADGIAAEDGATAAGLAGAGVPSPAAPVRLGEPGQPATFAEWMAMSLRREGLTQEAAARQLGVSVKTVSRWVGGTTEPRMRDLRRIQEVFGALPLP